MVTTALDLATARRVAAGVRDPELPMLTIDDLGILRDVAVTGGRVDVTITPTYSGCPAVDAIADDIVLALTAAGADEVRVNVQLAPAWTTAWMTPHAREALAAAGIAPPGDRPMRRGPIPLRLTVACPRCGSGDTREVSRFGATPCMAQYACRSCLEPFDHVKAH